MNDLTLIPNTRSQAILNLNDTSIKFSTKGVSDVLVIREDGSFLVKGVEVANDTEVYTAFKSWLKEVTGK